MREPLRDTGFVDEESTWPEYACDFAERSARTILSAADMIARPEIDNQIEAGRLERQRANVASHHSRCDTAGAHLLAGDRNEHRIEVDPNEARR